MTLIEQLRSRCSALPRVDESGGTRGERAFLRYRIAWVTQLSVVGAGLLLVATVLWWPLDSFVLPDPGHVQGFFWLRVRAIGIELGVLLGLVFSRSLRRHALLVGPLGLTLLLGTFGYSLGQIPARDHNAFSDALLGIVPFALTPVAFKPRLAWTLSAAGALIGGYFLLNPARWSVPGAAMQTSFACFAAVLTAVIGEVGYRVTRRSFFQRRELDAANARLAAMSNSLAETVEARTKRLRDLAIHLATVQENERRRIARDLHDDVGQSLTAMRYTMARVVDRLPEPDGATQDLVEDMGTLLDGTFTTVRTFLSQLHPRVLDDHGLVAAAEWHVRRTRDASGIGLELTADATAKSLAERLDPGPALALFRVLQEATTNALRHGKPSRIHIELRAEGRMLEVRVRDDGRGFDTASTPSGLGLLGLRERLAALGGQLTLESEAGRGTTVIASAPLEVPQSSRTGSPASGGETNIPTE
ncbi:MAG: sensor histidine kinase [Myxococcales bacterium]|nr:sensor histidine kinase [Myxococcales bacterium]